MRSDGLTLPEMIIFRALVAMDAGKHEVALALFSLIAEYFDWGMPDENEIQLASDAKGMVGPRPDSGRV